MESERAAKGWVTRKRNLELAVRARQAEEVEEEAEGDEEEEEHDAQQQAEAEAAAAAAAAAADRAAEERKAAAPSGGDGGGGGGGSSALVRAEGPAAVAAAATWELALGLEAEEDVSVETAFALCFTRTRKGGYNSLKPQERRLVDSFKVILWSYVAPTSALSMRALKVEAKVDEIAAAEQGTEQGQLAGVNLADGLVVDGYDLLAAHATPTPQPQPEPEP